MKYKGYQLVRRNDRTQSRWLIVGADGCTVARANTIKEARAKIDKPEDEGKLSKDEEEMILCLTRTRECKLGDCSTCGWRNKPTSPDQ